MHCQGWIGPGTTWANEMNLGWRMWHGCLLLHVVLQRGLTIHKNSTQKMHKRCAHFLPSIFYVYMKALNHVFLVVALSVHWLNLWVFTMKPVTLSSITTQCSICNDNGINNHHLLQQFVQSIVNTITQCFNKHTTMGRELCLINIVL